MVLADGKLSVPEVGIGIASVANLSVGVMGIGLRTLESSLGEPDPFSCPGFPLRLQELGLIESLTYSLYLNAPNVPGGTIIFGGVNAAKYTGGVWTVPLINKYAEPLLHKSL